MDYDTKRVNDAPLSVVNVQPGKRYRFRLVSLSCDPSYVFSIDGHNLTIIEADGVETDPWEVAELEIFAGKSPIRMLLFLLSDDVSRSAV
jgi:FtsP/CotA-like multicopper oxidase with cupredoxin domain